ncbi:rho GTPase-activating protein gacHH-like [Acanthaster planci]|uniref:Rab9 effector protein with kelch motifs n=1 Tax=Acanthaster planci TaxID=133434 RepID=A0A8B7ZKW2_ACAPL|nr:rho GTPase-activating protein gacHH-like [Acanthaster planci]
MALTLVSLKWIAGKEFTGRPPSPRQGHAIAVLDNAAYIFGGIRCVEEPEKGIFYFRDLHKLHFGKILRWEKIRYTGDAPMGRHDHALCAIETTLYVFGGRNEMNADECLPGLHAFSTKSCNWKHIQTHGVEPRSLNPGWAVVDKRIFVIGGIYKGEAHCNVDVLDTETSTWTRLSVTGLPPAPRCDHRLMPVGRSIYLFGGCGGQNKCFNDLHALDTDSLQWSSPPVRGDPPPPRGCHSLTLHADKDIYVFGGSNDGLKGKTTLGDLHKLSLAKMKWKRPFYSGNPPCRRFGHVACTYLNHLYIFGGTNEDMDYNDVKAAKLINPSSRKPLKVSPELLHDVLYGRADQNNEGTSAAMLPLHESVLSSATDQEQGDSDDSDASDTASSSSSSSDSDASDSSDED